MHNLDGVHAWTIALAAWAGSLVAMALFCAAVLDRGDFVFEHPCTARRAKGVRRRLWRIVQLTKELIATLWIRF